MKVTILGILACFAAISCVAIAQDAAAPVASPATFTIATSRLVVEESGPIEMRYSLAGAQTGEATVPVEWFLTFSDKSDMRLATPAPAVGASGGVASVVPVNKMPVGPATIKAVIVVDGKTLVPSNEINIVVKPDGWRAAAYKYYAVKMVDILNRDLKPHAFEFPELRRINEYSFSEDPNGMTATLSMASESLQVDDKAKTARLRTVPGEMRVRLSDPWLSREVEPHTAGTVEDGLIMVEFFVDCRNKWCTDKLRGLLPQAIEAANKEPFTGQEVDTTATLPSAAVPWTAVTPAEVTMPNAETQADVDATGLVPPGELELME